MEQNTDREGSIAPALGKRLQQVVAQATGLFNQVLSSTGEEIASTDEPKFCKLIKSSPTGLLKCQKDCARFLAHGIHSDGPTFFACHAGLGVMAVPVTFPSIASRNRKFRQLVMLGRVLTDLVEQTRYRAIAGAIDVPIEKLSEAVKHLRQESVERLQAAAKLTETIAKHIGSVHPTPDFLDIPIGKIGILHATIDEVLRNNDTEKALPTILGAISVIFDINECSLFLNHSQMAAENTITCIGRHKSYLHCGQIQSDGVMKLLCDSPNPFVTSDAGQMAEMGFGRYVQSITAFPLVCDGQSEGALLAFDRAWDDESLMTLCSVCNFIAARLRTLDLRRSVDRTLNKVSALVRIGEELSGTKDSYQLLEKMLDKSKEFFGAKKASLAFGRQDHTRVIVKADTAPLRESADNKPNLTAEGTIARYVIGEGKPILVKDITADQRFGKTESPECKSIVSVPLKIGDRCIGSINLIDKLAGQAFDEDDLKLLATFATQAAIAIERSGYYEESLRLKLLAVTDELTGLYNRRYFRERLHEELERSKRHSYPLSLQMIDLDNFKAYNDKNGHLLGDRALKKVAHILRNSVRTADVVSRYGGEEFIIIFSETKKRNAKMIAGRIKKRIEEAFAEEQLAEGECRLTVSLGSAAYPEDGDSLSELVEKADQDMYLAKLAGKNKSAQTS